MYTYSLNIPWKQYKKQTLLLSLGLIDCALLIDIPAFIKPEVAKDKHHCPSGIMNAINLVAFFEP